MDIRFPPHSFPVSKHVVNNGDKESQFSCLSKCMPKDPYDQGPTDRELDLAAATPRT